MKSVKSIFESNNLIIENPKEPFKNDYSEKLESFAENLTSFIEITTNGRPLVISLSAPWGMGKSTFIDMWGQYLFNNKKLVIKYDAWREDYTDNPLLSILIAINQQLQLFKIKPALLDNLKIKSFNLIKSLPFALTKFFLRSVAEYLGTTKAFNKLIKELNGDFSTSNNETAKKANNKDSIEFLKGQLRQYSQKSDIVTSFKKALKAILSKDNTNQTLFLFVDELDRCKPTFALSILETVKHFFDIENVCFILVSNKKVLFDMFRKVYGHTFESEGYFERFIDHHVTLPTPKITSYINNKINQLSLITDTNTFFPDNNFLIETINSCCLQFRFNLREIPKYLDDLRFFVSKNKTFLQKMSAYLPVIIFLIALKRKSNDDYFKILSIDNFGAEIVTSNSDTKIFPLEMTAQSSKKLTWLIRFFFASRDKNALNQIAKKLIDEIDAINSQPSFTQEQNLQLQLLTHLKNTLIDQLYGGYELKYNQPKHITLKTHGNHFSKVIAALEFLDYVD